MCCCSTNDSNLLSHISSLFYTKVYTDILFNIPTISPDITLGRSTFTLQTSKSDLLSSCIHSECGVTSPTPNTSSTVQGIFTLKSFSHIFRAWSFILFLFHNLKYSKNLKQDFLSDVNKVC